MDGKHANFVFFTLEHMLLVLSDSLQMTTAIRDFPRPDLEPKIGLFLIKKRAKTSQNGLYHSRFLSSTFW